MRQDDLETNRSIRGIFVKHWIDLGRVSIQTTNGNSFIHGSLRRIEGFKDELTSAIVNAIFSDIKHIRNIRHLRVVLDNWTDAAGGWTHIEEAVKESDKGKGFAPAQPEVYVVHKKPEDKQTS